jgi:hypothetical protein
MQWECWVRGKFEGWVANVEVDKGTQPHLNTRAPCHLDIWTRVRFGEGCFGNDKKVFAVLNGNLNSQKAG